MRAGRRACLVAAALLAFGRPLGARAQETDSTPPPVTAVTPVRPTLWARPAASLALPGAGQFLAGQDRGAIYAAIELYSLARIIQSNHEGHHETNRYRDLAYDVARRTFNPTRRDTVFEYYETMERFTESGVYDLDPGAALIPESDPATYNGSVWLLARNTFWPDPNVWPPADSPEYQRAVQFYQEHAVGPNYLWSWRAASLERDAFRESIRKSDDAFRRVQTQLGVLLANHLVSAVDALISSRLSAAAGRRTALRTSLGPTTVIGVSLEF